MIRIPNPAFVEEDGVTPEYLFLVSHKIVCPTCGGKGKHSNRLGAFTQDDWAQQSEEFKEDYLSGQYDEICKTCEGQNVIDEVTRQLNSDELLAIYDAYITELYNDRRNEEMERRYTSGDYLEYGGF